MSFSMTKAPWKAIRKQKKKKKKKYAPNNCSTKKGTKSQKEGREHITRKY